MRYLLALIASLVPLVGSAPGVDIQCRNDFADKSMLIKIKLAQTQEKCLATTIYGEARGESKKGKIAVAYSAINRAKKKTICQVVLAPKQYSIFNDNPVLRMAAMSPDAEPKQKNSIDENSWKDSQEVAWLVISNKVADPTKGATHYLADKIMRKKGYTYPRWSREYTVVAVIENHKFYKQAKPKTRKT